MVTRAHFPPEAGLQGNCAVLISQWPVPTLHAYDPRKSTPVYRIAFLVDFFFCACIFQDSHTAAFQHSVFRIWEIYTLEM